VATASANKFACIGHPMDVEQFRSFVNALRSGHQYPEKKFKDKLLIKLFEWTPSFKVKNIAGVGFNDTESVDGIVVMVPFLPEMKDIRIKEIGNKIEDAIAISAKEGCSVAALGGFTSIILQGQEQDISEKHGIKLTSGNTLTAAIIVRSVEQIAKRFGVDLMQATVAIIGASGDIGSGCTGYFCDKVKRLLLSARGMDKLQEVVEKYSSVSRCNIELFSDRENRIAISKADVVVFATSAYKEIVTLSDFNPHTIVCDASFPLNVKIDGELRPDVFIYHGGIVSLPFEIDPGVDVGLASTKTFYGCQVEGILMALHPELPCSWGRGNISREKLQLFLDILDSMEKLRVPFTTGNKKYDDREINGYASLWKILGEKEGSGS
jgi:fatty aldehyde-generating acyl-ACP reductase